MDLIRRPSGTTTSARALVLPTTLVPLDGETMRTFRDPRGWFRMTSSEATSLPSASKPSARTVCSVG